MRRQKVKDEQEQANDEVERIQVQLTQMHEANSLKERQTETLINELKSNYQQVQAELVRSKDLGSSITFFSILSSFDFMFNFTSEHQRQVALNQSNSQYEKQIKEYEEDLNRAARETQSIQNKLVKLDAEKTAHENKSFNTINVMKQDFERQYQNLNTQLTKLHDRGVISYLYI